MRLLLLLALLLYDVLTAKMYDYDDADNKRMNIDTRRNLRLKSLMQLTGEGANRNEIEERELRRYLNHARNNEEEAERSGRENKDTAQWVDYRHEPEKYPDVKSAEAKPHGREAEESSRKFDTVQSPEPTDYMPQMNCDREHERYEACFAGCAAISCDNPRERMRACYPFCEAGCVCVAPYVRDDRTHKCVLPEDCTKGLKGIPDLGDNEDTLPR